MAKTFEDALTAIREAAEKGLSPSGISKIWPGGSKKSKEGRLPELNARLATAVRDGLIRGPFKGSRSQLYFAPDHGPTLEKVTARISDVVLQTGAKLLSKSALEKDIKGLDSKYFADALRNAVSQGLLAELTSGKSKLYLHRSVAAELFGFATDTQSSEPPETTKFGWSDFLPIYRRLKEEQDGFSAVNIYDVIRASGAGKLAVHKLLIAEARTGRAAIHPTTSVELPREVIEAGIRLDGFPETFITVTVNDN